MWTSSKQWLFQQLNKIISRNPDEAPQNRVMHGQSSEVIQKKAFYEKMRGKNINQKLSGRLEKINNFYSKKYEEEKPLELACPICIEFFCFPVTTVCGHTFCQQCIDESLLFLSCCPVCRTHIRGTKLNDCENLTQITKRYTEKCLNSTQRKQYQKIFHNSVKWKYKREIQVDDITLGSLLDVQDTEYIWCIGIVKNIFIQNEEIVSVLIHYKGWNNVYDEVIETSSNRLANYQFYTSRQDIPRYRMDENNPESMYNYVVVGNNEPNIPHQQDIWPHIQFNEIVSSDQSSNTISLEEIDNQYHEEQGEGQGSEQGEGAVHYFNAPDSLSVSSDELEIKEYEQKNEKEKKVFGQFNPEEESKCIEFKQ